MLLHPAPVGQLQLQRAEGTADGRCLRCTLTWCGHRLSLVNTYWPTDRQQQRVFLQASLAPAVTGLA